MGVDPDAHVISILGPGAARELLEVLERSDADRAALIGRLYARDGRRGSPSCSWTSRMTRARSLV